jgi:polysaccharide pyruvyl transferase WcaK-like protein
MIENGSGQMLVSIARKVVPVGVRRTLRRVVGRRGEGVELSPEHRRMRRIVILDTWINDTNLGNRIIMDAVCRELMGLFPHDFFYHVPAHEYVRAGRDLVDEADYIFVAGTNLLSSNMGKTSVWRLRLTDGFWRSRICLMGVGWWQWQKQAPDMRTRLLLSKVLSRQHDHSVRDSYTARRLASLGFKALNTGCPTLWRLTDDHSAQVPSHKADRVLITFTEYNQTPEEDVLLFETVRKNYSKVYFWPQMYGDYRYARKNCGNSLEFIDPSLEALDDFLGRESVDYIGTRLHAGIRALQYKRRSIIVGIDNRAIEMGKDFNLPVLDRKDIARDLSSRIKGVWETRVRLDHAAIDSWKRQFLSEHSNP